MPAQNPGAIETRRRSNRARLNVPTHFDGSRFESLARTMRIGIIDKPSRRNGADHWLKDVALVIGGSVGGLFAAHLLRGAGWEVALFERAPGDLGDRGTGIGTREELFAVMRRIGLAADASIGIGVDGRVGLDRHGQVIHELPVRAVTSAWSRIWRPLRQALPTPVMRRQGAQPHREPAAGGVAAVFDDGSQRRGATCWLPPTDCIPPLARSFFPRSRRAMPVMWRGAAWSRLRIAIRSSRRVVSPDGVRFPGRRTDAVHSDAVAARRRQARLPLRLVPASDGKRPRRPLHRRERPLPWRLDPAAADPARAIATLKHEAEALLAPQLAALVNGTAQIILQPIFDLESPRIAFGRVALIGDAAFVARPHVATGVMKAAIDAESLVAALSAVLAMFRQASSATTASASLMAPRWSRAAAISAPISTPGMTSSATASKR